MFKRVAFCLLAVGTAAALLATAAPTPLTAHPQTPEDIERRLEELKRLRTDLDAREQSVRRDISSTDARRDALTIELQEIEALVGGVQARVDEAAAVLSRIQSRLDEKTAELRRTERELEVRVLGLRSRAAHIYKHGPASLLDMVAGAEGFGDLMRRVAYMIQVVRADNEQIAEIRRMRSVVVRERDAVTKLRDRAAEQMSVFVRERDRAASIARSVAAERSAVTGELQSQYAQLGDIQRQKEQYQKETAELEAESRRIAAFLKSRGSGPATVSPRGMIWPASGPVTSGYGWRTHPIFGTRRFHAGIDIGAPSGAPVVAASAGEIIFVGPKSGYGNTVIVDHGGNVATLYAHLSSIAAGTGTVVARGGRVGSVGCTGFCTGPHLHFEVRINGEPDNPMRWLP